MILASKIMEMNSAISVSVLLSAISCVGVFFSIYAILHSRNKEGHEKEVEQTKMFTRLEVKVDSLSPRIDNIDKTVEKTDAKMDDVSKHLARTDERINGLYAIIDDHRKRLEALEGRD